MSTFEQTYTLAAGGRVEIEQSSGSVRIVGWDQPDVQLKARSSGDGPLEERLRVESSPRSLQIEVLSATRWFSFGQGAGVDLELMVPAGTRVGLETGSGDVIIENTLAQVTLEAGSGDVRLHRVGPVRLETGSGDVTLNEIQGNVEVEVGSGNVTLLAVHGPVNVEAGSGDITLSQVNGPVELESGSGDVRVSQAIGPSLSVETGGGNLTMVQVNMPRVEVESAHGDVRLELAAVHPGGKYWVESSSGNVTVAVPSTADLSVQVESSSGRIRHEGLGLRVVRLEKGELEGVLGRGGARLSVESSAGDVTLQALQTPQVTESLPAGESLQAPDTGNQLQRVLLMVEEGKISPEEAERLLAALDEEEVSSS